MLSILVTWIQTYRGSERGQDLIEYAMLSGLIAIAILGAGVFFQPAIASLATGIGECIDFDGVDCAP